MDHNKYNGSHAWIVPAAFSLAAWVLSGSGSETGVVDDAFGRSGTEDIDSRYRINRRGFVGVRYVVTHLAIYGYEYQ